MTEEKIITIDEAQSVLIRNGFVFVHKDDIVSCAECGNNVYVYDGQFYCEDCAEEQDADDGKQTIKEVVDKKFGLGD